VINIAKFGRFVQHGDTDDMERYIGPLADPVTLCDEVFTKYCQGDRTKDDEVGEACSTQE
jgi:hypothetical protein